MPTARLSLSNVRQNDSEEYLLVLGLIVASVLGLEKDQYQATVNRGVTSGRPKVDIQISPDVDLEKIETLKRRLTPLAIDVTIFITKIE